MQVIRIFLDNAVQLYHCYSVDKPLYYILPGVCSTVSDPGSYGQDPTLKESLIRIRPVEVKTVPFLRLLFSDISYI